MSEEEKVQTEQSEQPEQPAEVMDEDVKEIPDAVDLGAIYDVPARFQPFLDAPVYMSNQLLKLGRGAIIELDRKVGEAIDIYVNNRLVARGEIVVMDDDQIGVTMTEIIRSDAA